MAGSVNKVILIGNLGRDPEIRSTQDGTKIANFTVATSERWRDRGSGEMQERTEWHRVVIFNERLVDVAERFLRKGSKVYLEGALQTRKWTDKDGQDRYTTEIRGDSLQLLGGRPSDKEGGPSEHQQQKQDGYAPAPKPAASSGGFGDFEDDIPFSYIGRGLSHHAI